MLRVLDLFSGAAGGWSLGLHRAGFVTVAACEGDPWRRAAFLSNFPNVRMYDDVRTLTAERLAADGIAVDVVVGSPPCQDASTARRGALGVDGERTGLFFEAVRLVRELRPRWACFENVAALRTRGYDRVHDGLEEAGYTVWPFVVGAWHAGAPHRRARVWIVAHANGDGQSVVRVDGEVARRAGVHGHVAEPIPPCGRTGKPAERRRWLAGDDGGEVYARWPAWNGGAPDFGRMDDGVPAGMARALLGAYGDAVVPQIPEMIGRAIAQADAP